MFEKISMTQAPSFLKKYLSLIILFILIVLISGVVWFIIIPIKQSLLDKAQNIQKLYAEEENRGKQMSQLPELKKQYSAIIEKESTLNILLTENKIVDFIKTLEELASETSVEMTITSKENGQITVSKKVSAKAVTPVTEDADTVKNTASTKQKSGDIVDDIPYDKYLQLSIKGVGQYNNIVEFLRKMETFPIGLDVIGMEMKKMDVTDKNTTVSGTGNNPFSFLDSGNVASQSPSQGTEPDSLVATFDVLIYVNK